MASADYKPEILVNKDRIALLWAIRISPSFKHCTYRISLQL